jgi:NTE family protein
MGGGASLGAAQVGMLQALAEHDITPDLIVGTSVGALNGAFLANDPAGGATRLSHIWPTITKRQIFPGSPWQSLRTLRIDKTHLYSNDGLAEFIDEHLPVDDLEDLVVPFAAMATDVDSGAAVELTTGPAKSALLASAALPGFLPSVERNGRLLYDGGLVAKLPIGHALRMGARSLVLLDCTFPGQPPPRPNNLLQVMEWSISLTQNSQARAALPFIPEGVPVLYLPGPPRARFSRLELDHTTDLIGGAYSASRDFLRSVRSEPQLLYEHRLPSRPDDDDDDDDDDDGTRPE